MSPEARLQTEQQTYDLILSVRLGLVLKAYPAVSRWDVLKEAERRGVDDFSELDDIGAMLNRAAIVH